VVFGYVSGKDGTIAGLALATERAGKYQYVGLVERLLGTATNDAVFKQLRNIAVTDPLVPEVRIKAIWVKPRLFCIVQYAEWGADGILKKPIIRRWLK
jgi:ATP-dependent DNA ligase